MRPEFELYDLKQDWYEWKNLANDPQHQQTLKDLKSKLDRWMKDQGDLGKQTELDAFKRQWRNVNKRNKKNKKRNNKKDKSNAEIAFKISDNSAGEQ